MELKSPKILLGAPTSKHKDYCFDAWQKHVKQLTYPVDVLLVDNTQGDNQRYAYKRLVKYFPVIHIEQKANEDNYNLITRAQNIIRNQFLTGGYDYLFMLETDHFPPLNTIEYLLSLNKPVVSLPYFTYTAFQSRIMQFIVEDFGSLRQSLPENLDSTFFNWKGTIRKKYQTGLGCTLIHRSVLSRIKFRVPDNNSISAHSDVYFHEDLNKHGIPNYVAEVAFSTHKNSSWFNILKK